MTEPAVSIRIDPDASEVAGAILRGPARNIDFRPAFRMLAGTAQRHVQRHLETEGTSTGPKFVRLSEPYAREKFRRWGAKPILTASGRLHRAAGGGPGWSQTITQRSAKYSVDPTSPEGFRYARAHQQGAGRLPRRPVIRLDATVQGGVGRLTAGRVLPFGTVAAGALQAVVIDATNKALGKEQRVGLEKRLRTLARVKTR